MIALDHHSAFASDAEPTGDSPVGVERLVRALPIRWRIVSIAVLNGIAVIILAGLIWSGARVLSTSWDEVRRVHESDALLGLLGIEAGRLQIRLPHGFEHGLDAAAPVFHLTGIYSARPITLSAKR